MFFTTDKLNSPKNPIDEGQVAFSGRTDCSGVEYINH